MKSRHFHLALVIAAYCFLLPAVHAQKKDRLYDLVDRAGVLYNQERYEEALKLLDEVIAKDPGMAVAKHDKIDVLIAMKRFDDALSECDVFLNTHADHHYANTVFLQKSNALLLKGAINASLHVLAEGGSRFPTDIAFPLNRAGIFFMKVQSIDSAIAEYQKVIFMAPNKQVGHVGLAEMMYRKKNRTAHFLGLCFYLMFGTERDKDYIKDVFILEKLLKAKDQKSSLRKENNSTPFNSAVNKENSFPAIDSLLSIGYDYDFNDKSPALQEALVEILQKVCVLLKDGKSEGQGFHWNYYAPFFIEVYERGYLPIFVRTILAYDKNGKYRYNYFMSYPQADEFKDWVSTYFNFKR